MQIKVLTADSPLTDVVSTQGYVWSKVLLGYKNSKTETGIR